MSHVWSPQAAVVAKALTAGVFIGVVAGAWIGQERSGPGSAPALVGGGMAVDDVLDNVLRFERRCIDVRKEERSLAAAQTSAAKS